MEAVSVIGVIEDHLGGRKDERLRLAVGCTGGVGHYGGDERYIIPWVLSLSMSTLPMQSPLRPNQRSIRKRAILVSP